MNLCVGNEEIDSIKIDVKSQFRFDKNGPLDGTKSELERSHLKSFGTSFKFEVLGNFNGRRT